METKRAARLNKNTRNESNVCLHGDAYGKNRKQDLLTAT